MSRFSVSDGISTRIINASSIDMACAAYAMTTAAHPDCIAQYNKNTNTVSFIDKGGKTVSTKTLTVVGIS